MSTFVTNGYYLLTLDTGIDISTATARTIKYKKPNGTTGSWSADLVETNKMSYQMTNTDLDVAGEWKLQAFVTIGGLNAYGSIVSIDVKSVI